jgi:hypothetical protein
MVGSAVFFFQLEFVPPREQAAFRYVIPAEPERFGCNYQCLV